MIQFIERECSQSSEAVKTTQKYNRVDRYFNKSKFMNNDFSKEVQN